MRAHAPFQRDDLQELANLYDRAFAVAPMRDIHAGVTNPNVIGLRHDVDDNPGAFDTAIAMAEWENARGYRSTYFLLHTADYWTAPGFQDGVERIAELGHEIGLHLNAITETLKTGIPADMILAVALEELREIAPVTGVVAHGDACCHHFGFVNDELFLESPRPDWGEPDRWIGNTRLKPVRRAAFGLEYDPNWLPRSDYLSDSGGQWSQPFDLLAARFPNAGQLHMLVHPDWWGQAFQKVEA